MFGRVTLGGRLSETGLYEMCVKALNSGLAGDDGGGMYGICRGGGHDGEAWTTGVSEL
jgi:hypothetical protein